MLKRIKEISTYVLVLALFFGGRLNVYAEEFVISDNGTGSDNEVAIIQEKNSSVNQTNEAIITNDISTIANTGENSASGNTGGDIDIVSGAVEENISLETNINSSYIETACCPSESEVFISENGDNSENNVKISSTSQTTIVSGQSALVTNNIQGYLNTGLNTANNNSGGDITISTGDVKVNAHLQNITNTSSLIAQSGSSSSYSAKISGNGSDSENEIKALLSNDVNIFNKYSSDIENIFLWVLNTGENEADDNTDGNVRIKTGDISLSVFIRNFANLGGVKVNLCCLSDESDQEDPDDPGEEGENPSNPGSGGNSGGGGGGGGSILPEAAATQAGGPGLAGLSDTSSGQAKSILFFMGLIFFTYGGKLITDEIFPQVSLKKKIISNG